MFERIQNIRSRLSDQKLDALFITNQQNVSYLSGFTGLAPHEREGFFCLTRNSAYLLTFPTYYGLYEQGGDGFITLNITSGKRLSDHLQEICQKQNIKILGVEKDNLTLAELSSLKSKLNITFIETEGIVEGARIIKEKDELNQIRKAAQVTDRGFEFIKNKIKDGVTEKDLALELEFFLKKNADDIAFSPIVAFNENAAIPHYLPSNDQRLTTNSLILLDFGAKVEGYCADMTRVVFYKTPDAQQVKIYNTVLKAQELALNNLRAGITGNAIDKVAREYITSAGYPEYPHGLGHGVGLAIHEAPRLRKDSIDILKENMVVTVEPGIYLPGSCGVRIEDLVILNESGIEILSKSPKLLKKLII